MSARCISTDDRACELFEGCELGVSAGDGHVESASRWSPQRRSSIGSDEEKTVIRRTPGLRLKTRDCDEAGEASARVVHKGTARRV